MLNRRIFLPFVGGVLIVLLLAGCSRGTTSPQSNTTSRAQTASPGASSVVTVPTFTPTANSSSNLAVAQAPVSNSTTSVFLILMENHNWADIANNPAAPYINHKLLPMASYARAYYNPPGVHPSEPNYLWLEAGTNFGVTDDGPAASNHQSSSMHLVKLLDNAQISWKDYQENIYGTDCPL